MRRAALIGPLAFILFSLLVPIGFFRSQGKAQTLATRQDAIQKLREAAGLLDFVRLKVCLSLIGLSTALGRNAETNNERFCELVLRSLNNAIRRG